MTRTIDQINQSILDKLTATPALAGLTSTSTVSIYRLVAYVVASVIWTLENLFDRHRAETDEKMAVAKPGTAAWYARIVKEFQQGDTLISDEKGIYYPAGSAGQRLVFQATAKENEEADRLFIKVAAAAPTAPGGLRALTPAELVQVAGYLEEIKFAGTDIEVVSREADRLKVVGSIHYNPLLELASVQAAVRAALVRYLQSLDFDGLVFKARLEDAIQQVSGVKDLEITAVSARAGQAAATPITRVYETQAGYIVEDETAGSRFLDTLRFVPYAS